MNNKIANLNAVEVWVVAETTPGELVYPTDTDAVLAYDITYPSQVPEYENSQERARTRDVLDRCQNQMPAGEWAFTTDARPNGLGVIPAEHILVESMAGNAAINPGTDVVYNPALTKPSFSLWVLADHTMFFCSGATVGGSTLSIESCPLSWQWSGMFMKMGITGTGTLTALIAATDTVIAVTNTDLFSVDSKVVYQASDGTIADDNGGAGYHIASIQPGVSITVAEPAVVGVAADGYVVPFNPGHDTPGNKLESRKAVVTLGGVEKSVADFTWTTTDSPEYLSRERTPSGYPESYVETRREVTGELRLIFREEDAEFFKQALESERQPMLLTVGDLPGYIIELSMPNVQLDMPVVEEVDPLLETVAPYTALAVTGEDSYKFTYK